MSDARSPIQTKACPTSPTSPTEMAVKSDPGKTVIIAQMRRAQFLRPPTLGSARQAELA